MIESAEEFYRLRTSENESEQDRATNEEVPEHILFEVIEKYPDMRKWVAHNKKVPLKILKKLASDLDWRVRHKVASKNKIDKELFICLSSDPDEAVRQSIAANRNIPIDLLEKLVHDSSEDVSEIAQQRLKELKKES